MWIVVEYLFGAASFVPHGYCLLWRPDLVALHAASDLLTAAAYFSIPVALFIFQRRRHDLAYPWVFRLFAAFIMLCGTTHVLGFWTLWQPVYGLQGLVKLAAALVSVATAIVLWPMLPRALALPSPAMLRQANDELAGEIDRRRGSEEALSRAHHELERRVEERTRELSVVNRRLEIEAAEHRHTAHELRQALSRLQQHMDNTPLGVVELELTDVSPTDASLTDGRIRLWSGRAPAIFRWSAEEVLGRTIEEIGLVHEADETKRTLVFGDLAAGRTASAVFTHRWHTRQHEVRHCRCHVSVVHEREGCSGTVLALLIEDITERALEAARMHRLAHHDIVSGLPNRLLFQDRLTQGLARAHRDGDKLALLMVDLDHFKEVNDSLGHVAGDQLLEDVAERLSATTRDSDTLARLGGDEFALVQTGIANEAATAVMADRLLAAMQEPFVIESHETPMSLSIGIALYPDDGDTVRQLMRKADMALYRAKAYGRGMAVRYDQSMDREMQASRSLQQRIREALEGDLFAIVYQPIVELDSGRTIEREALLRLDHPGGGAIPPSVLVRVAEASGLIQQVGRWVLDRACRDAARWQKGGNGWRIAINLSAAQLRQPDLVSTIEHALAVHGLDPGLLELEITETIFLDPSITIIAEALERLADIGVGLALDDFGTGYSSLGYLEHFPFSTIKLDASFVNKIGSSSGGESIVLAILALGHNLGKRVVAEGIETATQLDYLKTHECRLGQGYLLGRPEALAC